MRPVIAGQHALREQCGIKKNLCGRARLQRRRFMVCVHLRADEDTVNQHHKLRRQRFGLTHPSLGEVAREGLPHECLVRHGDSDEGMVWVGHFHRDVDEGAAAVFGVGDHGAEDVEHCEYAPFCQLLPAVQPDAET
jgi:hypothetical protein